MVVFKDTWLESLTSSNCHVTINNASIQLKLGTNVIMTISFVTTYSILKFLLPWQQGNISKYPKITILRWISKLISKGSMDWNSVKCFQCWLHVTLRSTWGYFKPLTSPKFSSRQEGTHSLPGTPLMDLFDRGWRRKKNFN
jgi:hypothetical protein